LILFEARQALHVVGRDGSGLRMLTTKRSHDHAARWSPDGRRIAFLSREPGERTLDVFTIDADGNDLRRLTRTTEDDLYPTWSPASQRVAFVTGNVREGTYAETLVSITTDRPGPPAEVGVELEGTGQTELTWSPYGDEIAFRENGRLAIVRAGSGKPRRLTERGAPVCFQSQVAWSPDARAVAFTRCDDTWDGPYEIVIVDVRRGTQTVLPDIFGPFTWSPDSRRIAYVDESEMRLYVGRADGSGTRQSVVTTLAAAGDD